MRTSPGAAGLAAVALAALAAGCQPLPHPFADDRPPRALLAVPDSIDIAVGSFEGEPRATAAKLGAAVAKELIKRDIPASERTTSRSSYRLDGRIEESPPLQGKATIIVFWRLRDAAGRIVNERSDRLTATAREWDEGNGDRVAALGASGANALAALLTDEMPKEKSQAAGGSGRVRVAVRKGSGAPGDGDNSLALSMATVLKRHDVDIVDDNSGKPDLAVDAEVTVDPAKSGKQHVKIVWRVSRGGGEVGTVAQENDIPPGRLDGPWGDVAYSVAIAAEGGVVELVDRGAPPLKVGTGPPASAAPPAGLPPPPVPPMPARPPEPAASPSLQTPSGAGAPDAPVVIPNRGVPLPGR